MSRTIQAVAWTIVFLFGNAYQNPAAEGKQSESRFVKLDSRGGTLSINAGDWAMVFDTATGLIWEVKTTDGSIHDMQAGYDWEGAHAVFLAELNGMKFGGFTDWRLPTTEELQTIWVKGAEPNIHRDFFPHTVPSSYLSWRKCGSGEIFDERVKFGTVRNDKKSRQVRAVRGGGVEQVEERK